MSAASDSLPISSVVSFVPEVSRTSPSPVSDPPVDSVIHPPVLMVRERPLLEQRVLENSDSDTDMEGSTTHSKDLWVTPVNKQIATPATLHPVHCYIPPEITDEIIAFVDRPAFGRSALCNFALVCKDWLPASRRCLFECIEFWTKPTRYDLFVSRVLRCEHMRPWLAHVRELSFREHHNKGRGINPAEPVSERAHRLVHDFSGCFPNLRYLFLNHVNWSGCPRHPSSYMSFFAQLHALQELVLMACDFTSFFAFCRTVTALPSLRHLTVVNVHWPSPRIAVPHIFPQVSTHRPKLRNFTLRFNYNETCQIQVHTLLGWLSQTPSLSSIRRVRCDAWCFTEHPEFFQALVGSVTEMFVTGESERSGDFFREDALSSFSRLVSLKLDYVPVRHWGKLAAVLQKLPSRLRQLWIGEDISVRILKMSPEGIVGTEDEGLELLDVVLDRDNFKSLESAHFRIHPARTSNVDEELGKSIIAETWKNKLPKLHARGIMKLDINMWETEGDDTSDENDDVSEGEERDESEGDEEETRRVD